jgi:hypothetical protein
MKSSIRKGFVSRFTSLFYRVKKQKNEIDLLEFWDNRKHPKWLEPSQHELPANQPVE